MAIQLQTVLVACRDRHSSFHKSRVPDAVLARALTDYQRLLLGKALRRDRAYLAQQASILFSGQSTSGAGVGGFPAAVANDGTVSRAEQPTGFAKELDTETATVLAAEFVPTSSTSTSITKAAAGWTVNAFVGQYVEVTAGTGVPERRVITSNTATVLNWTTALTTALDATSLVRVVTVASSVSEEVGVVTGLPAVGERAAYLIKLDATGTAYIDLTDPLVAVFDRGIPLPPFKHILGGTVWFSNASCPLTLTTYAERSEMEGGYMAYVMNRQLFVVGTVTDWEGVESIDLRYVPEPPALTALTDYLLLPDHAQPALVAHAAYVAGNRVNGLEGLPPVDLKLLLAERQDAEKAYLNEIGAQRQQTISRVQEAW